MRHNTRKNKSPKPGLVMIILLAAGLFMACDHSYLDAIDNMQDYTYSPVVAFPMVNASLSIEDIVDPDSVGIVHADDERLIWLIYRGRVLSIPAEDIFGIPDQYHDLTISGISPSRSEITLPPETFQVSFDNEEFLKSVTFLGGYFNVSALAPELEADGYQLTAHFSILNSTDSTQTTPVSGELDLDNPAHIDLSGSTLLFEDNVFEVQYTLTLSGDGTPAQAPYTIVFEQSMTDLRYEVLEGYIDLIPFPIGSAAISMSIFNNAHLGNIFFDEPIIDVIAHNTFGTPIALEFNEFFVSNNEEVVTDVETEAFDDYWLIDGPQNIGESAKTLMVIDENNSNLSQVMETRPNKLSYHVSGIINPEGDSQKPNFVRHDSNLSVDVEINLPMSGRIEFLELSDTLDLSFDDLPEELEWLELNITMVNGFPLDARFDIFFADENYEIIESLFTKDADNNIVEAAPTNPQTNVVTDNRTKNTTVWVSQEKVEAIRNSENIIIHTHMSTYNQPDESVKILDYYRLGIQIGARAKGKLTVEF